MAPTPLRHLITSFVASQRFSETFGGCVVQEDGTATVYATEEGSAAMRAALDGREWVIVVAHDGPLGSARRRRRAIDLASRRPGRSSGAS